MNCLRFSDKELIQRELNEMRFCGEVLSIETEYDNIAGSITFQPPKAYDNLLKRLRVIERQEEPQDIFII